MQNIVNGVDRDAIFATIDAIKQDAGVAAFEFRVENEWVGGGYNRTTIRDFHGAHQDVAHDQVFEVYNDEPPVLLSGDKGPNPVENLLHALAGCLTTSIVYHAAAQGKKVDAVRSRFEGDIDLRGFLGISDKVRNGYSGIRVVFEIEGDLSVEDKRELMAMGPKFSPVYDVVTSGTRVECMIAEDMARIAAE